MTENEIRSLMANIFRAEMPPKAAPNRSDWDKLFAFFETEFPDDFVHFMNLSGNFYIEGELLRVAVDGELIGDNTIVSVVIAERNIGGWPDNLIPFFSVGNGDYYCLEKGEQPSVVFIYHEDRSTEKMHESFEAFLKNELADFA